MANIKRIIDPTKVLELVKVSDISDIWITHGEGGDGRDYYDIKYILNGYSNASCEANARFWEDRYKAQKVLLKIIKLMQNNPKQFEKEYLVVFPDNIYLASEINFDDIDLQ